MLKSSELTHFQAKEISAEDSQTNFIKRARQRQSDKSSSEAVNSPIKTKAKSTANNPKESMKPSVGKSRTF